MVHPRGLVEVRSPSFSFRVVSGRSRHEPGGGKINQGFSPMPLTGGASSAGARFYRIEYLAP
jgi:hypothetical protein